VVDDDKDKQQGEPLIQRQPFLSERFKHLFGIHSWQQTGTASRAREYCSGCHEERNAVTRFRPPADFPSTYEPPQPDTGPEARTESASASPPKEEPSGFQLPPQQEETREAPRPFSRPQNKQAPGDIASVWRWFSGLRLWVKIMGGFIILQVVGTIFSALS
jgi:hypothetical protein